MSTYSRVVSSYPFGIFKPFLVTKYHILPNDLALKTYLSLGSMNKLVTESNINRPIRVPLKYAVVNSKEIRDTRGVTRSCKSKIPEG